MDVKITVSTIWHVNPKDEDMARQLTATDNPKEIAVDYLDDALLGSMEFSDLKAKFEEAGKEDEVQEAAACPSCGERRVDKLVWDEDGDSITCSSCGCNYVPDATPQGLTG